MSDRRIDYFNQNAKRLAKIYNATDRNLLHADLLDAMPKGKALEILDIGAGSGATAAMFAGMGHQVTASEPAEKLLKIAAETFNDPLIQWNNDMLPAMPVTSQSGKAYDVVSVMRVLHFLQLHELDRALEKLTSMVKPDGLLEIQYPVGMPEKYKFDISEDAIAEGINTFTGVSGAFNIVSDKTESDQIGRQDQGQEPLKFRTVIMRRMK